MARIVIDVSHFHPLHHHRGIGIYTKKLFSALQKSQQHVYTLGKTTKDRRHADLVHFPNFDFFFLTLPQSKTTKWIITVHDVIPLVFPNGFPPGIKGTLKFKLQLRSLKKAEAIITDSINSQKDIHRYLEIPDEKVYVVPLGVSQNFKPLTDKKFLSQVRQKFHLEYPFMLYVGDVNYNKNLAVLLQAFAQLPKPKLNLVMVSQAFKHPNIPEIAKLQKLAADLNISFRLRPLSEVSTEALVALYNEAEVYVQPSLYEGFGLPVLEALSCGTPVVTTNTSSLPEVSGEAAIVVEPTISGLATGIIEALNLSPAEKRKRIKLGRKHAAKFSWDNTARKTIEVYNQVLTNKIKSDFN